MTKGQISRMYQQLSTEDRRTFDRWLKANTVIGSIFSAALVAMALSASDPSVPGPRQATAQSAEAGEIGAAAAQGDRSGVVSPHELTIRFTPDQIPAMQVDEPF